MSISRALVEHYIEKGMFDEFSMWSNWKLKFTNSVLYDCLSAADAARKLGISEGTYRRHAKVFFKMEWMYKEDGHIKFKSFKKLQDACGLKDKGWISIKHNVSLEETRYLLKKGLFDKDYERQEFNGNQGSDTSNGKRSRVDNTYGNCKIVHMSARHVGKLFNRSTSSGQRFRKQLATHKDYKFTNEYKRFVPAPEHGYYTIKQEHPGVHLFYKKGIIWQKLAARVTRLRRASAASTSSMPKKPCYDKRHTFLEALMAPIVYRDDRHEELCRWLGKAFLRYYRTA